MMRRDLSLTIALCASLMAHAALALATFEGATRQLAVIRLPGHPQRASDAIRVEVPNAARLGIAGGTGTAATASPGDQPLRARQGPLDQALLSRDPRGPGAIGNLPSDVLVPQMDNVSRATGSSALDIAPPPLLPVTVDAPLPLGAGPGALAAIAPPRPRRRAGPAAPPQQTKPVQPPADAAQQSELESDAFALIGGVEFRDGRIDSRLGRAFKSVRPRLSLAAQIELMSLEDKRIVLKIAIDATGRVTSVDVLRSTGSALIDQPVKLVLYEWWFEPPKGPDGQAVADTLVLPISWH